jgi:uncharacterized protein (UPF0305 family)
MDLFTSPLEDEEMSLRELAMPSMKDIEMQKSDLALATTHYEVKPRIVKLMATKPFRGLEDDNQYRHIKEFTMICTRCNKKEFRPLGSSGIFFHSLSKMKREDGTHLCPLKQKEIGMS